MGYTAAEPEPSELSDDEGFGHFLQSNCQRCMSYMSYLSLLSLATNASEMGEPGFDIHLDIHTCVISEVDG